jgi:hypothetical protein
MKAWPAPQFIWAFKIAPVWCGFVQMWAFLPLTVIDSGILEKRKVFTYLILEACLGFP